MIPCLTFPGAPTLTDIRLLETIPFVLKGGSVVIGPDMKQEKETP